MGAISILNKYYNNLEFAFSGVLPCSVIKGLPEEDSGIERVIISKNSHKIHKFHCELLIMQPSQKQQARRKQLEAWHRTLVERGKSANLTMSRIAYK
jgi:hypothetical protein